MEIRQRALWHNILYISALAKLISATIVLHLHLIPSFNIHIVFSWVILLNRPQVLTKSYILAPWLAVTSATDVISELLIWMRRDITSKIIYFEGKLELLPSTYNSQTRYGYDNDMQETAGKGDEQTSCISRRLSTSGRNHVRYMKLQCCSKI